MLDRFPFLGPPINWTQLSIVIVDVLLVAFLIYRILVLIRGARAWRVVAGIFLFALGLWLSDVAQMHTLHWVLDKAASLGPVALVILLLPELRQMLESAGSLAPIKAIFRSEEVSMSTLDEVVAACQEMASQRIGALIVIEQGAPLEEVISTGTLLNAKVSAPLLGSLFYEGGPLHDGAVVIRAESVIAAACRLPLSENSRLDNTLHMRHRAALGLSEVADAVVIVVSEERGTISIAKEGRLRRIVDRTEFPQILLSEVKGYPQGMGNARKRLRMGVKK